MRFPLSPWFSDPHDRSDIRHEDFSVPDDAGSRVVRNGFDQGLDQVILGSHFDLHRGHNARTQNPERLSIPFPASESVEFRDRHPMYTHVHLGLLDCIQLELVDEGLIIFMSMILDRLARGR